ncbi:OLC1v1027199C1 [Oldenlandia corymbosa var. corymbosa]|uniref:OLC1v1027199C1 n=1 Tax=Oldenlandia corymbosa var. corymbosa TaxID=529605 RepID=A0AAV1CB41_OLDCO|nr:OLC1v1027199C1 [Oldenlandia corymbosa var. corymbosa]
MMFLSSTIRMKKSSTVALLQFTSFLLYAIFWAASAADAHKEDDFLGCLMHHSNDPVAFSKLISTPLSTSYSSILNVSIQNMRFTLPNTRKPQLILTPDHESQIQTAIHCSKKHNLQVRILSGGHDFEGSSYVSDVPFFVLNMFNFRSVSVDPESRTAWVGAGATLAFRLKRTLEQNATELVHKWQFVAPKLPENLLLELQLTVVQSNETGKRTVQASFVTLFEGGADELVGLMKEHFPELGVAKEDCVQLSSWVEFITYFYHLPIEDTYKLLKSRVPLSPKSFFKSKADFVQKPISKAGLKKLWDLVIKIDSPPVGMNWTPYGARMAEIPESEIPFPHRAGNIFMVFKKIQWHETNPEVMKERLASMRKLHRLMGEFVDNNNPRAAYADYRDLDLGVNNVGKTSVEQARIWGAPYFKNNFDRLVRVKTMVDPDDYFKNEQSIPPFSTHSSRFLIYTLEGIPSFAGLISLIHPTSESARATYGWNSKVEMKSKKSLFQYTCIFLCAILWAVSADPHQEFISCLLHNSSDSVAVSKIISTPHSTSYASILNASIQNLRFSLPNTPKPQLIITPFHESQIQTAIHCSKRHGLQMRILSGGHDFEGSSYVSDVPFFVLNMHNFRSISVDPKTRTAWVGAGVNLGQTYYNLVKTNSCFAFPAGYYATVGIGGHVTGGGYGPLLRKFGLAADNVVDARVIDAEGRILDRKSMGEDLFWAIRGGMGASFCVILEYKIKIVEVSNHFTVFRLQRTLEQNATELVHKWQYVAPNAPAELLLELQLTVVPSNQTGKRTVQATFITLFEGGADKLLSFMGKKFPELGLVKKDCIQLSSWVEFINYFFQLPIESTYKLLKNSIPPTPKSYFKSNADFIQKPVSKQGLQKIWDLMLQIDISPPVQMNWTPLGAKMAEIPESETPFPHRAGNIILVFKQIQWQGTDPEMIKERLAQFKRLYNLIGQFVDHNPRGAYADYRDLDLGVNNVGKTSVEQARIWGAPYFKNNFDRLVKVKTMVDPGDYFKNEQSIPPLS